MLFNWNLVTSKINDKPSFEFLRKAFDESIHMFKTIKDINLPLSFNYAFMESSFGHFEDARCLCQQFLRSNPLQQESWQLYTLVERVCIIFYFIFFYYFFIIVIFYSFLFYFCLLEFLKFLFIFYYFIIYDLN